MKRLISQLGFTLIELLVVISVIGVLAVAVLSSINPIEQINKGRDTRTRSDAAQLINAVDRYYATQEYYPWGDSKHACGANVGCATDATPSFEFPTNAAFVNVCTPWGGGAGPVSLGLGMCKLDATGGLWLDALDQTAEVKTAFVTRIRGEGAKVGGYAIYVYKGPGGVAGLDDTMYACFQPSSEAFKNEANQVCLNAGAGQNIWQNLPATLQTAICPGSGGNGNGYQKTGGELICLP